MKTLTVLIAVAVTSSILISTFAIGDDDDRKHSRWGGSSLDVAPVNNQLYQEECSECHMAYQPGFLPARSWKKLMVSLDEHFDENAELDEETQQQITQYLVENAADQANYKRSKAMMRSLSNNETPLRISETRYFVRKHDELPRRVVKDNPDVKSFSRCEVCHTEADKGSYNEHQVRIPGYGRWED
jgi:hypothetical protein